MTVVRHITAYLWFSKKQTKVVPHLKIVNANGKSVRSVHVLGEGECLVAADVFSAVGYDRDSGIKAIQRLVPEKYKVRLGDVNVDLEDVDKYVHTQLNPSIKHTSLPQNHSFPLESTRILSFIYRRNEQIHAL